MCIISYIEKRWIMNLPGHDDDEVHDVPDVAQVRTFVQNET